MFNHRGNLSQDYKSKVYIIWERKCSKARTEISDLRQEIHAETATQRQSGECLYSQNEGKARTHAICGAFMVAPNISHPQYLCQC